MESTKALFQVETNENRICQIGKNSDDIIAYKEYSPNGRTETSENVPFILLHGLMRAKETWDECGQIMSDRTKSKVYSLDARNHGDSKWMETMDYDSMADDVVQFMDTMSIPKAIIMGHGMGGKTGMILALKHPRRTHALILEDTSLNSHSKSRERLQRLVETFQKIPKFISDSKSLKDAQRRAVSGMVVRHYYYEIKQLKNKPRIWDGMDLPLKINAGGGFEWKLHLKSIAENMSSEPWKQSGVFEGPVLVIYGEYSTNKVLDEKVEFLKQFPRALYKPIEEGNNYSLHIEYPDMFLKLVCDFTLKQRGETYNKLCNIC